MIDNKDRFLIENYGKKSVFSNFLPGIGGEKGIPMWCFYVNRGQCVSSFGIQDKDHSIMQFTPAHQAYQNTKRLGFRTFLKLNGKVVEGFSDETNYHTMAVGMNELEIMEENAQEKYSLNVRYFTLPMEEMPGLVRCVTVKNNGLETMELEIIDGMPAILPFGIHLGTMNDMGQTAKAWMQVLQHESGVPIFKVRASLEDSAIVKEVTGGNFGFATTKNGETMKVIIHNESLFGYDTSLQTPHEFVEKKLPDILTKKQITENDVPCCFFTGAAFLQPGESYEFYEVYGQTEDYEVLHKLTQKVKTPMYFENKYKYAIEITETLTNKIQTHTGNKIFDRYCRQTYLDNVLRGGEPMILGKNKIFYIYSRKHGDMERDYNYFKMLPEFYSQGNGNFRDVNQNRRCDIDFSPYTGIENIALFYNAIQIDGYNPLGIEKMTYLLDIAKAIEKNPDQAGIYQKMEEFFTRPFTPGSLYQYLQKNNRENLFEEIMEFSYSAGKTDFIEGYWSDHWTYNLDLIEEYSKIFPDKGTELLFLQEDYTYTIGKEFILPARKRYVETSQGLRQYHFLEKNPVYQPDTKLTDGSSNPIKVTLIEKILQLAILKFAALDVYGFGVEMEGGKPGWYDALNGLPGLLGSSMAETYELGRNLEFLMEHLNQQSSEATDLKITHVNILSELAALLEETLHQLKQKEDLEDSEKSRISYWNAMNKAKEAYREAVKYQLCGKKEIYSVEVLYKKIEKLLQSVQMGIQKAIKISNGICPTYFYYQVTNYEKSNEGIEIKEIQLEKVPYFLEGPVRYLKMNHCLSDKKQLYEMVKKSELYDKNLKMYKVNCSLKEATYELGRGKAFTPGWLENESIWLHMEYKYLLELLKGELYAEFIEDFHNAVVPFLKEEMYGRSLFENSSFIASSANPNPNIHGKGFVARLSGSTVEFLNMWQIMMFGKNPFYMEEGSLHLSFSPLIPSYLIGDDLKIEATFLGKCKVVYHLPDQEDYIKGNYRVEAYKLEFHGEIIEIQGSSLPTKWSLAIRNHQVSAVQVILSRSKE